MTPIPTFQQILQLCHSQQLPEAEAACKQLLTAEPDNARALLLGGDIALGLGDKPTSQARLRRVASLADAKPEMQYHAAVLLARGEDIKGAAEVLRDISARNPGVFPVLYDLAQMEESLHRRDAALQTYEAAIAANPGHAGPFTRRAVILLRQALGAPLATPAEKAQPSSGRKYGRLTMSSLGSNGRFGNQLLQYTVLRALGAVHGLMVETPEWIGRWLFDLADPPTTADLPELREEDDNIARLLLQRTRSKTAANQDLWGYCAYHSRYFKPHRDLMRKLFTPGARFRPRADAAMAKLAAKGKTLVALHLRRGDFGRGPFWIAPESWYLDWLATLWPQLDQPVLYIASDDPDIFRLFAAYSPVTAADFEPPIPGAEFYDDFHVLSQADHLGISNSSFSFVASLLNSRARSFMRPDLAMQQLVAYDPWNADVLLPHPDAATQDT